MSTQLLDKIRSRGYWQVIVRPNLFQDKLIPKMSELYPLLQRSKVSLRGWDFPHLDSRTEPERHSDWIEQEYEWDRFLEVWRFYQSGQFIHISGIKDDWLEQSRLSSVPPYWKPNAFLSIPGVVFRFTEIYEFTARLALTEPFANVDGYVLQVLIRGLKGRRLHFDDLRPMQDSNQWVSNTEEYRFEARHAAGELIAHPRELALNPSRVLFERFHWDPTDAVLREIQQELKA